jgi:para-aminobenzoate synthetase/4-amino-4-deoxychorismate lyase
MLLAAMAATAPPSPTPGAWARFDDVPAGSALRFATPHRVLTAAVPSEVAPLLAELDRATRAGDWAFGYLGYEAAAGLDPGLATHPPAPDGPPVAWFGLGDAPRRVPLVAASTPRDPGDLDDPDGDGGDPDGPWQPSWTPERHRAGVERVREHIAAGETYQLNLTTRLRRGFTGDPERLYADLAQAQRARYCAYLDLGRHVVASASPELFLHWRGEQVTTRPMKGTAPRGRHPVEDAEHAHRLRASAKERAENVMIVDLMRNDLARIARTGGVSVGSLCALERYPTVLQLTSEVTARLRPEVDLLDVLRALFPCGSVTGAPKAATMRLIRELEDGPRGVYCGAIGWVGPPSAPSRARFSVAIRTAVVDRLERTACYGSGGGITWSSRAADEHAELLVKAAVLGRRAAEFELLETMGHHPGAGLRNLEGHLGRLVDSAGYFGFALDLAEVRDRLAEAVPPSAGAVVRLRLARSGALTVRASPLPAPPGRPVRLALDPEPMDTGQPWPFHKTSLRAPYTERAARHPGADDVLLCNERGELTESTIANLAVRLEGRWWTPPVSSGCLPGVERAALVRRGVLAERVLRPGDLAGADGVALVSSLRGWRPAVVDGG